MTQIRVGGDGTVEVYVVDEQTGNEFDITETVTSVVIAHKAGDLPRVTLTMVSPGGRDAVLGFDMRGEHYRPNSTQTTNNQEYVDPRGGSGAALVTLSDLELMRAVWKREIEIAPYQEGNVNPASIDLCLHPVLRVPCDTDEIDMRKVRPGHTDEVAIGDNGYVVMPNQFLLASTVEVVKVGPKLMARVEGKSSVGRVGLAVHITAGYIDPGFEGQITLEMANLSPWPIRIYPYMRIAQIAFQRMDGEVVETYKSTGRYQGQVGPTESKYAMEG